MSERDKAIKGLECCHITLEERCDNCPYYSEDDCVESLAGDALALLKAQEPRDFHNGFIGLSEQAFSNKQPVKPNVIMHGKMVMYYQCPACLRTIDPGDRFCRHCGRKVKWDD